MKEYFIINISGSDVYCENKDKKELLDWITEITDPEEYNEESFPNFINSLESRQNLMYVFGEHTYMIIKGELVIPQVKEITTKYDIK